MFALQNWRENFRAYVESTVVNYTGIPEIFEKHLHCPTCKQSGEYLHPILLDREWLKKPQCWQKEPKVAFCYVCHAESSATELMDEVLRNYRDCYPGLIY